MSSSVKYLKAVRTRYRNVLQNEISAGKSLLTKSVSLESDKNEYCDQIERCMQKIDSYREKVEIQSEKLASAIGDSESETETFETVIDADSAICEDAFEIYLELKKLKGNIVKSKDAGVKSETETEKTFCEQMSLMQQQMQSFMMEQARQQMDFMCRHESKGKESSSVKLPKLNIASFDGNKLKWQEFWDTFSCTVHTNEKISDIEKFSYLQSKLTGKAKEAIAGLELSNTNYSVAILILKERFGNTQEVVDLHYHALINLNAPNNTTANLRIFLDAVEKHLRSLEVLNQDVNQNVFISIIKSKLPQDVLVQLELRRQSDSEWTVFSLRACLRAYIVARERAEHDSKSDVQEKLNYSAKQCNNKKVLSQNNSNPGIGSAEALVATNDVQARGKNKGYSDKCRYCEKRHWSDECQQYPTIQERKTVLKDSCFRCLKIGHRSKDCRRNKVCVHCGANNKHHRSLCSKKFPTKRAGEMSNLTEEVMDKEKDTVTTEENVLVSSGEIVLMQTAKAELKHPQNSASEQVRLLLDCGSQRTYITENLAARLGLKKEEEIELKLITFGSNKTKVIRTPSTKLDIKLKDGSVLQVTANIVPSITGTIHRNPLAIPSSGNLNFLLKSLDMADTIPTESESTTIELLLGNDYYLDLVLPQRMEIQTGLYLLASKLGWILTGRTSENSDIQNDINMLIFTYGSTFPGQNNVVTSVDEAIPTKPDLEDFWNVESIGVNEDKLCIEDKQAMKNFKENLIFEEGRYYVTWPWKEDDADLPQNRELALGRLRSCLTRMKNRPDLLRRYNDVIQDQLQKGIIEKVNEDSADGKKHYLPHQAVINPLKTTTKLRIVYDASAKTRREHQSLNDCLYRGPVVLRDLCGILLRFRTHKIGIVADIEKAFLQVGLQRNQRDVTRFLWIKNCENPEISKENMQEFRFCRVPFGVISSPFLLGATINHHLDRYNTDVSKKVKGDIYVDNLITGTSSIDDAKRLFSESKAMFQDASVNLREWVSNDDEVNSYFPIESRSQSQILKVLGYKWNAKRDTLAVNESRILRDDDSAVTKRTVLKQISSVFDPMGLFSPVTLRGKALLQTVWSKKFDWDDEIDQSSVKTWSLLKSDLREITNFDVSRSVVLDEGLQTEYSLQCFCDASKTAYSTAVYLRQTSNCNIKSDLVFSKTRLAPVKGMSIPRLELMGVLIGARCVDFVGGQLNLPIKEVRLWSDSQCVLSWITTKKSLSAFVQNRVNEIKQHEDIIFDYITSAENPADLASRGCSLQNLVNSDLWWHGPAWLRRSGTVWSSNLPKNDRSPEFETEVKEKTKTSATETVAAALTNQKTDGHKASITAPFGIDVDRYSSLTRLTRLTALLLRFVKKLQKKSKERGPLRTCELAEAEQLWLQHIQNKHFSDVFTAITKQKPNNLKQQLGLFVDNNNLLRCQGRLENASLSEGSRRPVLLPRKERYTDLVIEKYHKQLLHSGVSQTLSAIRNYFWIPHGRATVKCVLRACTTCRRYEGGSYKMPPMASLPKSRVTKAVPFSKIGLDYLGPLYIRSETGTEKVWVCLFTCMIIRAVHLEVVLDASTEEFLLGLRRFIATRGKPDEILSDNASQFKAASTTLDLVWRNLLRRKEVLNYVSNQGIKWNFIVELAPWMGGFYERLVGIVKRAFRKSIGRNLLTLIQLQTLIKEVEAVLNSRPLVYVGDDINSNISLSPNHFLTLNPNTGIPESINSDDADYIPSENLSDKLLKIWRKGQKILNAFWSIWREEYLVSLRERTQTKLKTGKIHSPSEPKIGDVVLIKENLPRGCWKLGKIEQLVVSRDGQIRSAKVKLSSGNIIGRPLSLLYPIENSVEKIAEEITCPKQDYKTEVERRPTREAASKARTLIKHQLE